MRFCLAAMLAVLLTAVPWARGQSPEERYVQIYSQIQEADSLNAAGQAKTAIARYRDAQQKLRSLQTNFPGWQEKIIKYRIGYIDSKLAALNAKVAIQAPAAPVKQSATTGTNVVPATPGTNVVPAAPGTNVVQPPKPDVEEPAPAPPPQTAVNQAMQEQLKALQEEIRRLGHENVTLQEKVKEALKTQPAAADPAELAKAEDRIRELQKEADLLKATLEQAKAARPDDAAVAAEQKRLAELKQQLTEQGDVVQRLQKENDKLREENTNLREQASRRTEPAAPQNVTEITEELAVARATVSALQATNTALRAEMLLLEKQLLGSAIAQPAAPTPNEQLANTLKKIETELEVARARLEVYESKPVPYTVEELALFKQPDARMAISQQTNMVPATTNLASRRVLQPPPGSGPLFNEAIRAAEAGRMDEAEQKLEQVLRQDEKNTYTLTRLAAVEIDLKKWDEADGHLQTAQAVDPQEPGVLMVLGQLRYFQERYDEALDTLSRCAVVMPNEPRVYFFLGKTLVQKGNRQQAEKALRKVVQLRPGWGEGHYTLAVLYASQDPPFKELAQWHYEKALRAGVPANPTFERLVRGTETTASAPK